MNGPGWLCFILQARAFGGCQSPTLRRLTATGPIARRKMRKSLNRKSQRRRKKKTSLLLNAGLLLKARTRSSEKQSLSPAHLSVSITKVTATPATRQITVYVFNSPVTLLQAACGGLI